MFHLTNCDEEGDEPRGKALNFQTIYALTPTMSSGEGNESVGCLDIQRELAVQPMLLPMIRMPPEGLPLDVYQSNWDRRDSHVSDLQLFWTTHQLCDTQVGHERVYITLPIFVCNILGVWACVGFLRILRLPPTVQRKAT